MKGEPLCVTRYCRSRIGRTLQKRKKMSARIREYERSMNARCHTVVVRLIRDEYHLLLLWQAAADAGVAHRFHSFFFLLSVGLNFYKRVLSNWFCRALANRLWPDAAHRADAWWCSARCFAGKILFKSAAATNECDPLFWPNRNEFRQARTIWTHSLRYRMNHRVVQFFRSSGETHFEKSCSSTDASVSTHRPNVDHVYHVFILAKSIIKWRNDTSHKLSCTPSHSSPEYVFNYSFVPCGLISIALFYSSSTQLYRQTWSYVRRCRHSRARAPSSSVHDKMCSCLFIKITKFCATFIRTKML